MPRRWLERRSPSELSLAGLKQVAFDRAAYKYHGRVAALADAARDAGLDLGAEEGRAGERGKAQKGQERQEEVNEVRGCDGPLDEDDRCVPIPQEKPEQDGQITDGYHRIISRGIDRQGRQDPALCRRGQGRSPLQLHGPGGRGRRKRQSWLGLRESQRSATPPWKRRSKTARGT